MAHYYGVLKGRSKGEATRVGSKASGLKTTAATWNGAIVTYLWWDEDTESNHYQVWMEPWQGFGGKRLLAEGRV